MKILIATKNRHKLIELQRILAPIGFEAVLEDDLGLTLPEVPETGTSFQENAQLKAVSACEHSQIPSLADDSGLCVFALNGAPGIFSARYSGDTGPNRDQANTSLLLENMKTVPSHQRGAKFVCAICVAFPDGRLVEVTGECHGEIAFAPEGNNGFGYDPVFLVNGICFASLSGEEKDRLSHRGQALRKLKDKLSIDKIGLKTNFAR